MTTFYGSLQHNYEPKREDNDICTVPFLEATKDSIIGLLDVIGPTAFAIVKSDVSGNIQKLYLKYESDKERFITLGAMLDEEKEANKSWAKNSATDALLWLNRGLGFICSFIRNVLDTTSADKILESCMTRAYESSLKEFHGWMAQKLTSLTFKALPYREGFISSLSNGAPEEQFLDELRAYHQLLELHVQTIDKLFIDRDLDLKHC
ncbi:glycolipid transfer protein-like [Anneissia japonica]|uniref:glycolipid transfer protein-like n=1 Tax=Anneissia japonica TaxID=1529436 RepID=UPI0014258E69|nr:glycolipid transfer protein-like [Anneissia japonica]XP_033126642.1 glycolipid transfer protein-like [Anneissia japonica]XP_033126643.1 glycolipid transfer protein-like [Anneissia japonica]XP_033126644.1 glycolipid transfer protein-like [Anneissia japonica]XP_033126645.1 glycolipid transfer protein-like [Anneissia japonica]